MTLSITQHSFTTGKVGENVLPRTDVEQVQSALKESLASVHTKQGPVENRTGTIFVGETKYADRTTRIEEFTFSVGETLIIEIGDLYMRFWQNGAQVVLAYEAWTAIDYLVGALVTESGNYYRCLIAHTGGVFATDLAADKWVLSGGVDDVAYEIVTPYPQLVVNEISISGDADVLYIAHDSGEPNKISRFANDHWLLETFAFFDGPYEPLNNNPGITCKVTAVSGTVEIESNVALFGEDSVGRHFRIQKRPTTVVDGAVAAMIITAFTDATHVDATMQYTSTIDVATYYEDWRFGAFGPPTVAVDPWSAIFIEQEDLAEVFGYAEFGTYNGKKQYRCWRESYPGQFGYFTWHYLRFGTGSSTWEFWEDAFIGLTHTSAENGTNPSIIPGDYTRVGSVDPGVYVAKTITVMSNAANAPVAGAGWPDVVGFHQERVIFASAPLKPQTLWASEVAKHESFGPTNSLNELLDDSAFAYGLSSGGEVNKIAWMLSAEELIVGTLGEEFVSRTQASGSFSATSISFIRQSTRGSVDNQTPQLVGSLTVYAQRHGNAIRGLAYDLATDKHRSIDLTKFANTILSDAGGFAKVAYQPEPSSMLYYQTGDGSLLTFTTSDEERVQAWSDTGLANVQSVAIVSEEEQSYSVYVVIKRTINGSPVQYIERLAHKSLDPFEYSYLDSALASNGLSVITVATGLEHLEGETVTIFADGEARGTAVVSSGQVTLGGSYTFVLVGLPYSTVIQLSYVEGNPQDGGSTQGKKKRVVRLICQTVAPTTMKVGISLNKLYPVVPDEDDPTVFIADVEDDFSVLNGDLFIVHEDPTPFSLAIATREVEFRD